MGAVTSIICSHLHAIPAIHSLESLITFLFAFPASKSKTTNKLPLKAFCNISFFTRLRIVAHNKRIAKVRYIFDADGELDMIDLDFQPTLDMLKEACARMDEIASEPDTSEAVISESGTTEQDTSCDQTISEQAISEQAISEQAISEQAISEQGISEQGISEQGTSEVDILDEYDSDGAFNEYDSDGDESLYTILQAQVEKAEKKQEKLREMEADYERECAQIMCANATLEIAVEDGYLERTLTDEEFEHLQEMIVEAEKKEDKSIWLTLCQMAAKHEMKGDEAGVMAAMKISEENVDAVAGL